MISVCFSSPPNKIADEKMRVCFLSAFEDSMKKDTAASMRVYNLARGLVLCGNDVQVILAKEVNKRELIDGISVHSIKGFCPNTFLKVLKRFVGIARPASLYFYDFLFITRISQFISQSDVVQIEQQMAGGFLTPFIRRILKKPVVIDCHDTFQALRLKHTSILRRALETFQERLAYKHADLILTVSEAEKNCLVSYGVIKSKIEVIPNGVDTKIFASFSEATKVQDQYSLNGYHTVIFVGNMDYAPNQEALETLSSIIAPMVLKEVENTKFLIVGKTSKNTRSPNLIFTGFVNSVRDLLAVSDVAVAPLYHGSGTRLKVLEYFSCGLPVVSTSFGVEGIDVTDGGNVIIEDAPKQFAAKIIELLRNKSLSLKLGGAARKLVESKYDWGGIALKLDSILRDRLCKVSNDPERVQRRKVTTQKQRCDGKI